MTSVISPESCKVYTPDPLARAMVSAILDDPEDVWLEPGSGRGVFLRVLAEKGVLPERIRAVELDAETAPDDGLARVARGTDFLSWAATTQERFDKVVGNPPYVPIGKLDPALRRAATAIRGPGGEPIGLNANCWLAFLCASVRLLQPGGSLCLVLPAAWEYASYAERHRRSIQRCFAEFEAHRSRKPLFDGVQEGCIVLLGRGFGCAHRRVDRMEHEDAAALIGYLENCTRAVPVLGIRRTPNASSPDGESTVLLQDVVDLRLGGVTGDVRFFLLTEEERLDKSLPVECLRPTVSRARHLSAAEMTREGWSALRDRGERAWLFDPPEGMLSNPAVQIYLGLDPDSGGCRRDRQKIRCRTPWYRTLLPGAVDGFVSGMSRLGPWICLNAMSELTATNTLYTIRFRLSASVDERAAWALALLTSRTRDLLAGVGRLYADGLVKYEPRDLRTLPLPKASRTEGARRLYHQAIGKLLKGDVAAAVQLADEWFE